MVAHKDYTWVKDVCGPDICFLEIDEMNPFDVVFDGDVTSDVQDLNQRALLIYTSGTTGRPKGAVISNQK